jgi:hypothetical protein
MTVYGAAYRAEDSRHLGGFGLLLVPSTIGAISAFALLSAVSGILARAAMASLSLNERAWDDVLPILMRHLPQALSRWLMCCFEQACLSRGPSRPQATTVIGSLRRCVFDDFDQPLDFFVSLSPSYRSGYEQPKVN